MTTFVYIVYAVSLAYFMSFNFIYLGLQILAFFGGLRRFRESRYTNFSLLSGSFLTPPVSVVIPAFNEEVGILNCVYSAVRSHYPEFEVVVVNDGSEDDTLGVLMAEFDLRVHEAFYRDTLPSQRVRTVYRSANYANLWVIDKENGGKADSLNAGANFARYKYIVTSDADSIFDEEGLIRIVRLIGRDPDLTVGVGGQIRIGNGLTIEKGRVTARRFPPGMLARLQVVEYLGSFLGNRTGWSELNSVLVLSGAFGMWRRQTLMQLGGMTGETTHEDIEFTFRVHERFLRERRPYRITFVPDPIVWTEVPVTWGGIFAQRRRWQRVVIEVFWRYRRMFLNPRYGTVGMVGMPYLLIYEILGPFLEIGGYLLVFFFFLQGTVTLPALWLFLLVSFGLTVIVRGGSLFIEQYSFHTFPMRAMLILFMLAFVENLGYHQYISIARIAAMTDVFRGKRGWARIQRQGFSKEEQEARV